MAKKAIIRCCASCEWIFRTPSVFNCEDGTVLENACPKCGFGHYPAVFVHGRRCYRLERTQEPYIQREIQKRHFQLQAEVRESNRDLDKGKRPTLRSYTGKGKKSA